MQQKIPVLIAIVNGLSGVMAWAYRLKKAFPPDSIYSIQLMACRESSDYGPIDLFARNQREARQLLIDAGEAVVAPNFIFDLFDICHDLIHSGLPLRTIGFCRSDSMEEYYEPLSLYQNGISHLIAVSDQCAGQLSLQISGRKNDISILPTGIDYSSTLIRQYSNTPIRIIYAGRFEQKQKRIFDLLPLLQHLQYRKIDFRLTLAGGGKDREKIMRRINTLPYAGCVKFIGRLPYDQMAEIYRNHDLFIQLSEYEGTSNSMLEAMAQGAIPVVTETESGSRSVIQDGINGSIVPIGDMRTMADRIATLSNMGISDLEKTGRNAHDSVESYSMPNYIKRFIPILDKVMSAPLMTDKAGLLPAHRIFGLPMPE